MLRATCRKKNLLPRVYHVVGYVEVMISRRSSQSAVAQSSVIAHGQSQSLPEFSPY
jgi:hypothetical protein